MAIGLDLGASMANLAAKRPLFNSEADFQLALGWEIPGFGTLADATVWP
jgi:hypothetical protein